MTTLDVAEVTTLLLDPIVDEAVLLLVGVLEPNDEVVSLLLVGVLDTEVVSLLLVGVEDWEVVLVELGLDELELLDDVELVDELDELDELELLDELLLELLLELDELLLELLDELELLDDVPLLLLLLPSGQIPCNNSQMPKFTFWLTCRVCQQYCRSGCDSTGRR